MRGRRYGRCRNERKEHKKIVENVVKKVLENGKRIDKTVSEKAMARRGNYA
jgi:hypothetical protein